MTVRLTEYPNLGRPSKPSKPNPPSDRTIESDGRMNREAIQLRAILDAYRAWVDAQRTWNNGDEEFETLTALLAALTKEGDCQGKACLDGEEAVVWIEADHSHTGEGYAKLITVDACIADIVRRLYPLSASSCCGHRQEDGRILFYDGRVLRIYKDKDEEGAMPDGAWGFNALTVEDR